MVIEEQINKWVESYEGNGYLNGSILVAVKDHIILNKGFGMANWEHQVANKPTTKFRIGSLTKAFTALAVFQLQEEGKLTISDSIGKYIPNYPQGDNITIYHCLTNTSGIPNFTSFPDFWYKTMRLPSTLNQLIESFKHLPLNFEPGSRFEYSSSGFMLLTAIIETVSDLSYGDYIQENICRPLGMYNTGCDDGTQVVPDLATGYSFWEKPIHSAYADLSFPLGAYGLYSTTEDLFLWDQALRSSKLLGKELMQKMLTPNLESYACGWMVDDLLGKKCVHHFGDISGFFSDFLRFDDEEVTIIFLSNMDVTPVMYLTRDIAKVMFNENVTMPLPLEPIHVTNIESLSGKYLIDHDENRILDISVKQGELYLTVPKRYGALYKFQLVPVSMDATEAIYVTEMVHEQLVFHFSLSGDIEHVAYKDYYGKKYLAFKDFLN